VRSVKLTSFTSGIYPKVV